MESVHHENPGLRVFNLQPGVVYTDMAKKSGYEGSEFDDPGRSLESGHVKRCSTD